MLRTACVVPIALGGLWLAGVRYNATPSVPVGLYRVRAFALAEVARGTYVCLRASSDAAPAAVRGTRWALRDDTLLKRAAGLPGDRITSEPSGVAINGEVQRHSAHLERDDDELALPRAELPLRLREHEFWLGSDHDRGFDSRYFGPVHQAALSCIAEPLWIF